MRTSRIVASLAAVAFAIAACSGGGTASPVVTEAPGASAPGPGAGAVSIVDFGFEPAELDVTVGSTVTWTNTGAATHTVKWSDGTPESDGLASAATYERTFDKSGTYPYVCGIHGSMTGTITVTE